MGQSFAHSGGFLPPHYGRLLIPRSSQRRQPTLNDLLNLTHAKRTLPVHVIACYYCELCQQRSERHTL